MHTRTPYSTSTGLKSLGGQTIALECAVTAVELIPDGTDACDLQVYDGKSSGGVKVADLRIPALQVAPMQVVFDVPVYCNLGAFTVLGGANGTFIIHYIVI